MKKSLLIGNGINSAIKGNGISWQDLLNDLSKKFTKGTVISNEHIPFPLTFEEIIFINSGQKFDYENKVKNIKEKIASVLKNAEPNKYHKRIMESSNVEHILTTNYEYSFEKVLVPNFDNNGERLPNATLETKHSIKRRNNIYFKKEEQKSVWHIHGEINHNQKFKKGQYPSQSIQIGYEHYGEYLYEIQSYVLGKKYTTQESIPNRLRKGIKIPISWIDILFNDNLIIIGLSLDFSEIDLWWLLNYRKKVFSKHKDLNENTVVFYYPSLPREVIEDEEKRIRSEIKYEKKSAIASMLETLGVKAEEILCVSYEEFYKKVLDKEKI
jgi:hypothetical protein